MNKNIIDLERIVERQAWDMYKDRSPKSFPKKLKDVSMVFDWSKVTFTPEETEYKPFGEEKFHTNIIFKSVFENKSDTDQTHILKAERQTVSECKCSLSKGFSMNADFGLELAAPFEIAKASVGFSKGYEVQNARETTNQRTLTWSTEGNITVGGNKTLTAELHIKEKQCEYTFTSRVRVRGIVMVNFYSRQDNNKFLMTFTGDICSMLLEDKTIPNLKTEKNTAILELEGKCNFKFGIEQQIVIS